MSDLLFKMSSSTSRFVTFEVTYEDIVWMGPKQFITKRDVSFAGLSQRVASAFPRTLRPGAPLGDSMGSMYGANFVLSANVDDHRGGGRRSNGAHHRRARAVVHQLLARTLLRR